MQCKHYFFTHITLVNVYVDFVVFTRIAGTSLTGSGRSFLSIRHAHGDLCKHLGIYSSTDLDETY